MVGLRPFNYSTGLQNFRIMYIIRTENKETKSFAICFFKIEPKVQALDIPQKTMNSASSYHLQTFTSSAIALIIAAYTVKFNFSLQRSLARPTSSSNKVKKPIQGKCYTEYHNEFPY